jgi:hypothetical protein
VRTLSQCDCSFYKITVTLVRDLSATIVVKDPLVAAAAVNAGELDPPHSITSSASARIDGGGARSRAFAVLASMIEVELRRLIDRDVLAKRSNADQWFYFFLSAAIWPDCVSSTLWTG